MYRQWKQGRHNRLHMWHLWRGWPGCEYGAKPSGVLPTGTQASLLSQVLLQHPLGAYRFMSIKPGVC